MNIEEFISFIFLNDSKSLEQTPSIFDKDYSYIMNLKDNSSNAEKMVQSEIEKKVENNNNIGNEYTKKTTKDNTSIREELNIKKIEKIFNTRKENIKIGRIKKELKDKYFGEHNKYSEDNIIRKIKISFVESILKYLNIIYEKEQRKQNKKIIKRFQKVRPDLYINSKRENNLKFFDLTIRELFSDDLSPKNSRFEPDYNKKMIDKIYKANKATELINILNKTIRAMYNDYSGDCEIEGFDTLKKAKSNMEKKGEEDIEKYWLKFESIAKNLEIIIKNKRNRRPNCKK